MVSKITECKSAFKKLIFFTNEYHSYLCCFTPTDAQNSCFIKARNILGKLQLGRFLAGQGPCTGLTTPSLELQQWLLQLQPDLPQMQYCICYWQEPWHPKEAACQNQTACQLREGLQCGSCWSYVPIPICVTMEPFLSSLCPPSLLSSVH